METKQKERIRRLMELLKKTDRIHLKEAARMLEVSVMTIRRDLSQDDEPLPLTLLGGYIVMVNKPPPSLTLRSPCKSSIIATIYRLPFWPRDWSVKTIWSFLIMVRKCRWWSA